MDWMNRFLLIAGAFALGSCALKGPPLSAGAEVDLYEEFRRERAALAKADDERAKQAALEKLTALHRDDPSLEVIATGQATAGGVMKFRATLRNPLPETVEGAWLVMRLFASPENMRQLEVHKKEISATVPSGDTTPLRWDVESMYWGSGPVWFVVDAYPKRVGDRVMSPPSDWK